MRTKQGGQLFEFTQERLSALLCAYGERRDNSEQAKQFRVCRHVESWGGRDAGPSLGLLGSGAIFADVDDMYAVIQGQPLHFKRY
jgi:hypothetical protein